MAITLEADLRGCVQRGEALLVVGAGVSAASTTQPVATWQGLLLHGIDRAAELGRLSGEPVGFRDLAESSELADLLRVADEVTMALGGRAGGEYGRWLRETVGSLEPEEDDLLSAIAESQIPLATTNYDGLLEGATGLEATTWQQPGFYQRVIRGHERAVLHLHGYWRAPESVVLGSASYGDVVSDPFASVALQAVAFMKSLVFVGFGGGLEDPNFHGLRVWMREVLSGSEFRHFRLVRSSERDAALALHHPDERIVPVVYGDNYNDLPVFLRSLGRAPVVAITVPASMLHDAIAAERALTCSRIAQRFSALGLSDALVDEFADDPSIGPPPPGAGGTGVRLIVGEAGSGKSIAADRLYLEQLARFESGADLRVPVYLRARDVAPGELGMRVFASPFGSVGDHGAFVIIDGADEPGPSTPQGLLEDAEELLAASSSSAVTVFSREFASSQDDSEVPWETQMMTYLSDEQVAHLRSRLGATEGDPWPWSGRWDREAHLPVFVLIVTQYVRGASADLSKDEAIAFVRDAVVNEAIEGSEVDSTFFDELAAQWIHSSGEVTVRDVAATHDLRSAVSRCRVLAVDARGYLSFRVPEVAWSLAARYLERDVDRFAAFVEDPIVRHRWMPAVEVAVRSGDVDVGNELLHMLVIHAPGLVPRLIPGMSTEDSNRSGDPEREVQCVERAMESWLRGIGPLKDLTVPHLGDTYPEYRAQAGPGGVSSGWRGLPVMARVHHRNRPWMGRHWEWSVTSGDLSSRLSEVLRYGLPPLTDVGRHEAEFELATRITRAPKVASMARTIEFVELEAALGGDFQNVAVMQQELIDASRTVARLLIERLEERGETVIEPPWAPGDDLESLHWVWDGWTIEELLVRGRQVSRAALDIYRAIVDRWFPAFRERVAARQALACSIGRVRRLRRAASADDLLDV